MARFPDPYGSFDRVFRANSHLNLTFLTIPFLLVAVFFEAEWAAWTAMGIWVVVFVLHLFIGKKPPRR